MASQISGFPRHPGTPSQGNVGSELFGAAPSATQAALQSALSRLPGDPIFRQALVKLAGNAAFQRLTPEQQVDAIDAFEEFARGGGELGRAEVLGNIVKFLVTETFKGLDAANRDAMVGIIGGISAFSAEHPSNQTLRNTLDKVLDDHIALDAYQAAPVMMGDKPAYNWGMTQWGRISLNTHSQMCAIDEACINYLTTIVHEANHILNARESGYCTKPGTVERFIDEYRAEVVGMRAAYDSELMPGEQFEILNDLVDGTVSCYADLGKLYHDDPKFRAGVEAIYAVLCDCVDPATGIVTPGRTVSPEAACAILISAGNDSAYLSLPGNLDNH